EVVEVSLVVNRLQQFGAGREGRFTERFRAPNWTALRIHLKIVDPPDGGLGQVFLVDLEFQLIRPDAERPMRHFGPGPTVILDPLLRPTSGARGATVADELGHPNGAYSPAPELR